MSADPVPSFGIGLFEQHQQLLADSAIDPGVAQERGYCSVDTRVRLEKLGFAPDQRSVPGLLIPVWSIQGDYPALHLYRPDNPRFSDLGHPVKYENAPKTRPVLDIHPRCRVLMEDIASDLIITEGSRKVDAAVSYGYVALGVLGVDMWAVKDENGFRTPLSDWKHIALKGRKVYICFDSDVTTKQEVRRAMRQLVRFLTEKGANVEVMLLPDGPNGEKTGLDDYLGRGGLIENIPVFPGWDFVVPPPPEPIVLPSGTFPTEVLPNICQRLVAQILLDVGPGVTDFAAAGILPVAAAALGRDYKVDVGGDWVERGGAIWLALVGAPGVKKSPVLRRLIKPIEEINKRYGQGSKNELQRWMEDRSPQKGPRPPWRQIKVGDITMERLAQAMEWNPLSLLMVADELKGWAERFNQYRGGDDRQKWLSFWVGANELIQRKGNDYPIDLIGPTISIIGGIQPSVLGSMFHRDDDGLAPRMLFALGQYEESNVGLPNSHVDKVYREYSEMIDTMHKMQGAVISISGEARELADTIYRDLERKAGRNVDGLGQVHAKMEAYLFRFAGIFNGFDAFETGIRGEVTSGQIERAFAVVEYFTETARIVRGFDEAATPQDEAFDAKVERVRKYMRDNPGVTKREISRHVKCARKMKDLEEILQAIEADL